MSDWEHHSENNSGMAGQQSGMSAPLHPNGSINFRGLNTLNVYRSFISNVG